MLYYCYWSLLTISLLRLALKDLGLLFQPSHLQWTMASLGPHIGSTGHDLHDLAQSCDLTAVLLQIKRKLFTSQKKTRAPKTQRTSHLGLANVSMVSPAGYNYKVIDCVLTLSRSHSLANPSIFYVNIPAQYTFNNLKFVYRTV